MTVEMTHPVVSDVPISYESNMMVGSRRTTVWIMLSLLLFHIASYTAAQDDQAQQPETPKKAKLTGADLRSLASKLFLHTSSGEGGDKVRTGDQDKDAFIEQLSKLSNLNPYANSGGVHDPENLERFNKHFAERFPHKNFTKRTDGSGDEL
jgi:hypothetical protein